MTTKAFRITESDLLNVEKDLENSCLIHSALQHFSPVYNVPDKWSVDVCILRMMGH